MVWTGSGWQVGVFTVCSGEHICIFRVCMYSARYWPSHAITYPFLLQTHTHIVHGFVNTRCGSDLLTWISVALYTWDPMGCQTTQPAHTVHGTGFGRRRPRVIARAPHTPHTPHSGPYHYTPTRCVITHLAHILTHTHTHTHTPHHHTAANICFYILWEWYDTLLTIRWSQPVVLLHCWPPHTFVPATQS